MRLFGLSLLAIATLPGCATVFEGPQQYLAIRTAPVGASCSVERDGELLGVISSTPGSVLVHRSPQDITVLCRKPGWQQTAQTVESKFNGTTISSILLLPAAGIIGVSAGAITDASTGANHSYDPPPYLLLQPAIGGEGDASLPQQAPASDTKPHTSAPAANQSTEPTLALR